MDKINNINFTGISNIGICEFKRSNSSLSKSISMILKDDFNGKDLTEFKSVLKKVTNKTSNYINEETPNLLNIEAYVEADQRGGVMLNRTLIELSDKNLPLFSYLAKMTRRIGKMQEKEMVVNKDYINYEAKDNLIAGSKLQFEDVSFLDRFFDRTNVKSVSEEINGFIQTVMEVYLGIK